MFPEQIMLTNEDFTVVAKVKIKNIFKRTLKERVRLVFLSSLKTSIKLKAFALVSNMYIYP